MHLIGLVLKECAIKYYKKRGINSLFLENDYNHCTMLIYCHHSRNKTCKMPFHCDTLYNQKHEFSSHNTMKNNSAVLVYTVGDERNLRFRMRHYGTEKGRKKWVCDKTHFHSLTLSNNSLFVLHPCDELPVNRFNNIKKTQIQHGNIKVKEGDLSIEFVFRCVTQSHMYQNINDFKTVDNEMLQKYKDSFKKYDETT